MVYRYLFQILLSILLGILYSVFEYTSMYSFFFSILNIKDTYMIFIDINIYQLGYKIKHKTSLWETKLIKSKHLGS